MMRLLMKGKKLPNILLLFLMMNLLGNVVISKKIPTHTQDHGDA